MSGDALDFVPTPAPDVESYELDGERLVWRGASLHRLDALGALVWDCFDGQTTVGEMGRMLAEAFGASELDVRRDVSALCTALFAEGLLAGGHPQTTNLRSMPRIGRPPSVPLDPDDDLPYTSGRFQALHYDFAIRTNDARLAEYFDRTLQSFAAKGMSARWYSIVTDTAAGDRYRVYLGAEGLLASPDVDTVVRYVLWHVNQTLIKTTSSHLLVHAAGATLRGRAVVLPGQMNAGKSTLVAGLLLDGFGFLTDEMVALDLNSGLVDPYPRPMNIGSGSWQALARLRPADRDEVDPFPRSMWHVDASSIRTNAVASPAPIRWIIAPRFEPGAPARFDPLSRPEAVQLLHRNAFNRYLIGSAGVRALVRAVSRARCTRMVSGDLPGAVAAVRDFLEGG